jgi:hypothetical protein
MIHVVVMKCLIGLTLLINNSYILRFYEGVGVGVLKIEESKSEVFCTDSTALSPRLPTDCGTINKWLVF